MIQPKDFHEAMPASDQSSLNQNSHQTSVHENQQQPSYPVCLNKFKCLQGRNTPLSRLSEVTYQSQLKISTNQMNNNCQLAKDIYKCSQNKQMESIQFSEDLKMQNKFLMRKIGQLEKYIKVIQKRNQQIVVTLQKEKIKNAHLQHALTIISSQEDLQDKKVKDQLQQFASLKLEFMENQNINQSISAKLQQSRAQNNYLKQLILLANNNYENLQKKYLALVQKNKKNEQENAVKQKQLMNSIYEMKNIIANILNNSTSPILNHNLSFGEHDENTIKKIPLATNNQNQKKQVEQIYRNMFIKTLKTKK